MDKVAKSDHPIHELIAKRWSSRAFSTKPVEKSKILSLLEAARWAPSSFNEQPWRYIVFTQSNLKKLEEAQTVLLAGNSYAKRAPVLICAIAKISFTANDKENRHSFHDLGAANAYMFLEAVNQGLIMHEMAGYDVEKAREVFMIPIGFDPVTMIAIGYQDTPDILPDKLRDKEAASRARKPLDEIAFVERWGNGINL